MKNALDLVIAGGMLIDGTGSKPVRADVGIRGGAIEVTGDLSGATADSTLDAAGAIVAPGFIDVHGHSDYTLLVDGRAVSQVSQGVTTEVIGNCGHGCEPLTDELERFVGNIYGFNGSVELTWRRTSQYLERLAGAHPAINVVPLTPVGNLRRVAMAGSNEWTDPATATERKQMMRMIDEAMEAGSNGISFGLEYRQEASATMEELVTLSAAVGKLGGIAAVHTRDKDRYAVEAVEEAIAIARQTATPVQVSHILPRRTAPAGSLARIVDALGSARSQGLDLAFDVHTRTHGITNLSDCISPELLRNGRSAIEAAIAKEQWSKEVERGSSIIHRFAGSGWNRVQVFSTKYTPGAVGASIAELAETDGCAPWEAVRRLLDATAGDVHNVMVVCDSYDEADIIRTASLDGCLVGSDATTLCPDGLLAEAKFLGAYSWAAWMYSKLTGSPVRMTPEKAIAKLSAEPAERFRLKDRGIIAAGKKADIVVVEPMRFGTAATIRNPNVLATGVRHVVVNGQITLRHGAMTGARAGEVLR
ncbi:MAG: amidohydrolase family protein [Verrucomicrobia bacterium]|nr:amidohydrolase family protein [Verrucomicrobiota bacterium]